ncbi:MAG: hypothetical protein AAFR38_03925 [Planctomycetota bacterium]
MRMRRNIPLVALCGVAGSAWGQGDVGVDFDPMTPGLQNVIEANPGDLVTAALVVRADAFGISAYQFSALLDSGEVGMPGANELLPTLFEINITPGPRAVGPNAAEGFEAVTFADGPVSSSFVAATITFTAANPTDDGQPDVTPALVGVDGGFLDNMSLVVGLGVVTPGFVIPVPPCSPIDFAAPFGVISQTDVSEFVNLFFANDPRVAALASPFDIVSQTDVTEFVNLFFQGCPS